ncbi:MAG: ABC transporter permease [Dongiaceae bacterium]
MGAVSYIAKRIGLYLAVLFIGLSLTFVLPRLMPVDPVEGYIAQLTSLANVQYSPEAIVELRQNLRQLYGLEGSLVEQYFSYLKRVIIDFDFGPSFTYFPQPVSDMIRNSLPWTMGLLITATLISWVLGNAVGIVAGYFDRGRTGAILELVGILLYPIPYYILAVLLIMVFGYIIPIFPLTTTFPVGDLTLQKVWTIIYNSILPAITIVIANFGYNILSMKALSIATKEEPFVVYARLKGTSDRTRMTRYVFRNALLPQVTALALQLGVAFNGALLTEIIFSYPGLGLLMRQAATSGDFNVLYAVITVSIIAVATAGLIIDLCYPLLDPRIRYR